MTIDQFYYLVLVVLAFGVFGVAVAVNHVRYRRWLAVQPVRPTPAE